MTESTATAVSLAGPFDALGVVGRGAGSSVLKVRHRETGRLFAMKVAIRTNPEDQKYLDQLKHEYQVLRMLSHPNIPRGYDVQVKRKWFRDHEARILMDLVDGKGLEAIRDVAVDAQLLVYEHVASALAYMHHRGVIHADVKPHNIMIDHAGRVWLVDFGTARIRGETTDRVQGTLNFMAPEQATKKRATPRSDIYSLGATMYHTLTGRNVPSPLAQVGGVSLLAPLGEVPPARELNPDVPELVSQMIQRCCQANPQDRPEAMHQVERLLHKIVQARGIPPNLLEELDL